VSEAAATATTVTATPATGPPAPGAARHAADAHGDAALVAASRRGDREAFEELVRRTARLVYARAYLETGDRHRAEDLVQETFLTAWRKLDQLTDAAGFRPWLMTILHSVLIDSVRRASRKKRKRGGGSGDAGESDVLRLADPSPTPAVAAQTNEERQRALSILRSLPREYQQVLMLRYLAGADYDTIARQLALTNGSLRGLLHRGLAMLRKEFERE
jgi:RNA polymerase sigma-70 factor (ECF subfamily)